MHSNLCVRFVGFRWEEFEQSIRRVDTLDIGPRNSVYKTGIALEDFYGDSHPPGRSKQMWRKSKYHNVKQSMTILDSNMLRNYNVCLFETM